MRSNRRFYEAAKFQALMAFLEAAEAKICNCAACQRVLLSAASHECCVTAGVPSGIHLPEVIAGRSQGRPFCKSCLKRREITT